MKQGAIRKAWEHDGMKQVDALLAHGGEVGSCGCKYLRASERAEAATYFLLDLDHANVLFCLIIGKGYLGIKNKPECVGLIVA